MAAPVRPDNRNRRTDSDALEGLFCKFTGGPYSGRVGVFHKTAAYNTGVDGYPLTVVVREARTDALLVDSYANIAPLAATDRAGYG